MLKQFQKTIDILLPLTESTLQSYSLLFFNKNNRFALLLMLVTFLDVYTGLAGLLAVVISNMTAWFIGLNETSLKTGNYGFNALLVGLALGIQYQPSIELYVILFFGSLLTLIITVFLEGWLAKYRVPYLTLPFMLAVWIIILATRSYEALSLSERGIYFLNYLHKLGGGAAVKIYEWFSDLPIPESLIIYFKSLGAIFFQYNILAGIIIALALLMVSRISFMFSLTGYYTAYLFYQFIGGNINELNYNYIGFNYILTAIAIGGIFVIASRYSFLWVILLTPLISLVITSSSVWLESFQLPVYSMAFNVVVILFLYLLIIRNRHLEHPALTGVQFLNAEKNLYYQHNNRERFNHQQYIPMMLPVLGEWTISQGYDGEFTHRNEWKEALDFVITDQQGSQYQMEGNMAEDYYCYNKPVIAVAGGIIEEVIDGIADNRIEDMNLKNNWGNTVIVKHQDHLYSKYSHLKQGTITVKKGEKVNAGTIIGYVGNSGRSPYPHLHFQVQRTPWVGSKTLYHPIAHFICYSEKGPELRSYEIPKTGQKVSNIEEDKLLQKALHFVPGQRLTFENQKKEQKPVIHDWEVKTDMYNQTYLFCKKTNSKAYLYQDGTIHYFTHFTGDKKSLLYYFFLAFFKVPMGFYKQMAITDQVPLHTLQPFPLLYVQDILAPFVFFIKTEYRLRFIKRIEDFTTNQVELQSTFIQKVFGKKTRQLHFKTTIDSTGIQNIRIQEINSRNGQIEKQAVVTQQTLLNQSQHS